MPPSDPRNADTRLVAAVKTEGELRSAASSLTRLAAWLVVAGLVLLSVMPPAMRPVTSAPHELEHFMSFALAGALQYLAYSGQLARWLLITLLFTAGIELLQLAVPGRHARLADFAVDALAGCIGVLIGFVVSRALVVR